MLLKCLISVYLVSPVILSFRISSKSVSVVASDDFERVMQTARILYITRLFSKDLFVEFDVVDIHIFFRSILGSKSLFDCLNSFLLPENFEEFLALR